MAGGRWFGAAAQVGVVAVFIAVEPLPAAVTVSVTWDSPFAKISTGSVRGLKLWPAPRDVLIVQVRVPLLQVQPVPDSPIEPRISFMSRLIATVIVPEVAAVPVLETVIV